MAQPVSGAQALARGAVEAGVSVVTGYPGSPATGIINHILATTRAEDVCVEWTSNEKVAMEVAFGATLGGLRSLLCIKSVGLNVALDPLMVYNLSGCRAGFVILVGDDPEGWGSQNEQDSRTLALAAELPLLEPSSVADAREAVKEGFRLSEALHVPVIVRFTRALAEAKEDLVSTGLAIPRALPEVVNDERPHSIVLPIDVVSLHQELFHRLQLARVSFEHSPLNHRLGDGKRGIVAAGFAYRKLMDTLGGQTPPGLSVLALGTAYPLPETLVIDFLNDLESVLVLEETAPVVETLARAAIQQYGLNLPVYGRSTGDVPRAGELGSSHIAQAVRVLLPDAAVARSSDESKAMPSRVPLCPGCPYVPTFDALMDVMHEMGGRDRFIVVGDPGCMVRSQVTMPHLLDVKHGLGSSIGMAAGIAVSLTRLGQVPNRRVVALAGDSGFLHTGLNGLMDAIRLGVNLLVIILDNGTVALTGGQPHPGTPLNARGQKCPAVDLASIARAAGSNMVETVDVGESGRMRDVIRRGLAQAGVSVVIAHGVCPPARTNG